MIKITCPNDGNHYFTEEDIIGVGENRRYFCTKCLQKNAKTSTFTRAQTKGRRYLNMTDETILTIDATIITGALVFLTFSQVGVALTSPLLTTQNQINIAQIYKAIATLFGLGFIGPFAASAISIMFFKTQSWARGWLTFGLFFTPALAMLLFVLYVLTGYNIVGYIPPPTASRT